MLQHLDTMEHARSDRDYGPATGTGKSRKNEIDSAFILLRPMHAKRHNNVCDELVIRQCRRRLIGHTVLGIREHEPDGLVQALSTESVTEQQNFHTPARRISLGHDYRADTSYHRPAYQSRMLRIAHQPAPARRPSANRGPRWRRPR